SSEIYGLDAEGRHAGKPVADIKSREVSVTAGARAKGKKAGILAKPKILGPMPPQKPNPYLAVTTNSQQDKAVDSYETRFGIRSIECKPDGVYVNGERIRIQGVNQHHDLGALGVAFNERAAERQLQILREMGCNAIRTAHNPPAPGLLELTDR